VNPKFLRGGSFCFFGPLDRGGGGKKTFFGETKQKGGPFWGGTGGFSTPLGGWERFCFFVLNVLGGRVGGGGGGGHPRGGPRGGGLGFFQPHQGKKQKKGSPPFLAKKGPTGGRGFNVFFCRNFKCLFVFFWGLGFFPPFSTRGFPPGGRVPGKEKKKNGGGGGACLHKGGGRWFFRKKKGRLFSKFLFFSPPIKVGGGGGGGGPCLGPWGKFFLGGPGGARGGYLLPQKAPGANNHFREQKGGQVANGGGIPTAQALVKTNPHKKKNRGGGKGGI